MNKLRSPRRRDLYLTKRNIHTKKSMLPEGFEPKTVLFYERTAADHRLNRSAIAIDSILVFK
jgi:hypothetical protein